MPVVKEEEVVEGSKKPKHPYGYLAKQKLTGILRVVFSWQIGLVF